MDDLIDIEQYLSQIQTRKPGSVEDEDVLQRLAGLKEQAVSRNDQLLAKKLWCYETILQVQNKYISAFEMMKEQDFYSAWCVLERVEINLVGLERHFDLDTEGHDKLRLSFIKKHTEQFQSLFPYRMFISPAYMALEKVCSVCDKPISIRNPCGHVVGEIYDGEMCVRIITKVDLIEISLVPNPAQKYSVVFLENNATGKAEDHYNYWYVDYVVRGLNHPFAAWETEWTAKQRPISDFRRIGRNEPCPCGSGDKFKKCCINKEFIETKQLLVKFSEPPPEDLLPYEDHNTVRGKSTEFPFLGNENLMKRIVSDEENDY